MASSSTLAGLAGAFLASEAVGVTDVTPIGRGDNGGGQSPLPSPDGGMPPWAAALLNNQGGGDTGIPPGLIELIGSQNEAIENLQGSIGSGPDTSNIVETIFENMPTPSPQDTPNVPNVPDMPGMPNMPGMPGMPNMPGFPTVPNTPGSGSQPGGPDGEYNIQDDYQGPAGELVRVTAETGAQAGSLVDTGVDTGTSFASQNPYTTAAATGAAALNAAPGIGNVAYTGAVAAGGVADITSDAVTGGTPLGAFTSPLDVTNKGAWWEGPDYLGNAAGGAADAAGGAADTAGDAYQTSAGAVEGAWNYATPNLQAPTGGNNPADTPEEPQGETEGDYGRPTHKLLPDSTSTGGNSSNSQGSTSKDRGMEDRRTDLEKKFMNPVS